MSGSGKTPGQAAQVAAHDLAAIAAFGSWIRQTDTARVLLSWQERSGEERSDWRAVAAAVRMTIEAESLDQTAKPQPGQAARAAVLALAALAAILAITIYVAF